MTGVGIARHHPWDRAGCFVIDYVPGDLDDPRRRLVKELKAGSGAAADAAAALLAAGLADLVNARPAILVAVPGHVAGSAAMSERLCARVAALLPSARHCPGVLRRLHDVPQSSTAPMRPSIEEHLSSLRVEAPLAGRVILVDDVFTHGRVSGACSQLILDAGARSVLVSSVARTRL